MLLMLLMLQNTVSKSCRAHVCLTWKIQNASLVLICKVNALNLPITFYDPFNNETGFCVPHAPCHSLLQRAVIEKNNTLDEIIFKIPLKMQLNGWWTCKYGDNNERAVTEVTLQDIPSNAISDNRNSIECWTLMMLWCVLGFASSYMLVRLIVFFLKFCNENLEETISSKAGSIIKCIICGHNKSCECCPVIACKKIIVFILSATLFISPLFLGLIEGEQCKAAKAAKAFPYYGASVGIICCLLLINKDQSEHPPEESDLNIDAHELAVFCPGNAANVVIEDD